MWSQSKKDWSYGSGYLKAAFHEHARTTKNLLGSIEGIGLIPLMQELPRERLSIGLTGIAAMRLTIELIFDHNKEREAFEKPI